MEWKKNAAHQVEITGYNAEGSGVARVDGRVIFVPATIAGEIWDIVLVKVNKNFAFGRAVTCITPSPKRVEMDCPYGNKCGGCQFRHMNYEEELKAKTDIVKAALERIAGVKEDILPIIGAKERNHYRNKVQFQVAGSDKWIKIGFYRSRSHDVLDTESCLLQGEFSTKAREVLKTWMGQFGVNPFDENTGKGTIRHLFLRSNEKGEVLLCLVATRRKLPYIAELLEALKAELPDLKGFILNVNPKDTNVVLGEEYHKIWGEDYLYEELSNLSFKLSVPSFFQVNLKQTEVLYKVIAEFAQLSGTETVLDLYCGTGTIGLSLAKEAKKVIGIEIVSSAVEDAKENATRNGIENAEFILGDCGQVTEKEMKADVVIVDPPRKGLSSPQTVLSYVENKLIYTSCDPGTLARDLKFFTGEGFIVEKIQPVDLFPGTKHVETVVLLTKKK
ncbi:MAG: 23S rRNA (uracil(1939)-C(5))-methyltransferase RlmD [Eubacteriales bacterium]